MSITKDPSGHGTQATSRRFDAPLQPFTLRDLYVRASISGNSLAAELGRYLNIDESTFASSSKGNLPMDIVDDETSVHEQALAAILEVVTTNSKAAFEYVRVPEPQGGIQEWWARMLSGTINNAQTTLAGSTAGEDT
jgi:hypothetical protein